MPFEHAEDKQQFYHFRSFLENMLPSQTKTYSRTLELAPQSPLPPFTGRLTLAFAAVLLVGVMLAKLWWNLKQDAQGSSFSKPEDRPQAEDFRKAGVLGVGTALLQKDLGRKESVEWVNMVSGKVWKVYRRSVEGRLVGLIQPLIANLKKSDWVKRVEK